MNIAVLSGKGGTGKTTVSTNLAKVLNANYIDCDVEEPDGFIFLKPKDIKSRQVEVEYPCVDDSICTMCGECVRVCQFNALARTKKNIITFEKLCHGCGACGIVCKSKALTYKKRVIGVIDEGKDGGIICKRGVLNVGEPMAVPVIRELLSCKTEGLNILDCSPGTSCNVINTLQNADVAVLVTEPTEFGFHDLKLSVTLLENFTLPFGLIINKYVKGENTVTPYCKDKDIPILGCIPYSRDAARIYSSGDMLASTPMYRSIFEGIADKAREVFNWNS